MSTTWLKYFASLCCRYGESVGDLDVVDGARRSVTCIALEEGCLLVQVRCLGLTYVPSGWARLLDNSGALPRAHMCAHWLAWSLESSGPCVMHVCPLVRLDCLIVQVHAF